ncbi:MAG: hypothetical protein SH819_04375 [Cytophagales bacterium]|nr:hypothetical protein [Cytophagales bacterium]
MTRILILAFSDLRHDARIARQIDFLKDSGTITVACFDAPPDWSHEIIRIKRIRPGILLKAVTSIMLLLRLFPIAYRLLYDFPALRASLASRSFDLIVANDIESLPLAVRIRKKEKILFDAHEYAPRHFEDKWVWRVFFQDFNVHLCRKYLSQADAMTTVGEGLAVEYKKQFGVNPIVITNAAYYTDLKPGLVTPGHIKLIHHGAANPSRQLELMIRMMDYLDDRFTLDMMLLTPAIANKKTRAYLGSLKSLIATNPRVRIIDPVPTDRVIEVIHGYDIGVFLLPPVNFNYANTLPNKFFDFVQARLAVAIGPTPEMKQLVDTHDLGVVAETFTPEALADKIGRLTEVEINRHKLKADQAARVLSAETNRKRLHEVVSKLLPN